MMDVLSLFTWIAKPVKIPVILSVGTSLLMFSPITVAQENVGSTSEPLTTAKGVTYWTTQNNQIPVCWETDGYDREKRLTQEAVTNTWEWYANTILLV